MKYKYKINGLDCANCAREVEEFLAKDKRLKNVVVNFNTAKLSFEAETGISIDELNRLVQSVEPEATVNRLEAVSSGRTKDKVACTACSKAKNDKTETRGKACRQIWFLIIGLVVGVSAYFAPLPELVKAIC